MRHVRIAAMFVVLAAAAGACSRPPYTVVDATGKYLTPGFTDMHVHIIFAGMEALPVVHPAYS